jgi:hypothetical protein
MYASRRPSTKIGIDTPTFAPATVATSITEFRRYAEMMPSRMPTVTANTSA